MVANEQRSRPTVMRIAQIAPLAESVPPKFYGDGRATRLNQRREGTRCGGQASEDGQKIEAVQTCGQTKNGLRASKQRD